MTSRDIIVSKLREIGADGLCCDNCWCEIDDLAPGCEHWFTCVPARKTIATEAGEYHEIGDEVFVPMETRGFCGDGPDMNEEGDK